MPTPPLLLGLLLLSLCSARDAGAVMDIRANGPTLHVGNFVMRVTNVGVLGNAFYNTGLSFDPSFEYPRGSGHELLNHAELWVGATNEDGQVRVSGGPMLEWRPTLAISDTVRVADAGDAGTRSHEDDDGDGRIDEEQLNGRDDDGDGRVDEDFLMPTQQMLTADYTDDQPEAVNYAYPEGESHLPLHLAVHQRVFGWSLPGHDGIAGIEFTITNRGAQTLRGVQLGLYADLDSRETSDLAGHLNDQVQLARYAYEFDPRSDTLELNWVKACLTTIAGTVAELRDATPASGKAGIALAGLSHTTDPLGFFVNDAFPGVRRARDLARAPRRDTTFRFSVFVPGAPPGQGGPPRLDADRMAALRGEYPTADLSTPNDFAVLITCGEFAHLDPGQSLTFSVAMFAVAGPDSLLPTALEARLLEHGKRMDLQPNAPAGRYVVGNTGVNGHEICYEPPPGVQFNYDPHCPQKLLTDPDVRPIRPQDPPTVEAESTYVAGRCIWTDLDCDLCTGDDGVDEVRRWERDVRLPPPPSVRAIPGDGEVTILWDNTPEQAILAGRVGGPDLRFAGYKLYRLDDWRRVTVLPSPRRWQRLAVYREDTREGGFPLSGVTDEAVLPDGTGEGGPHYPIGRYRVTDPRVLDGFDYHYAVTTILREVKSPASTVPPREYESPFVVSFDDRVVPHTAARPTAGGTWVVPNPYRGRADWERQPVPGDAFTRHVDFMGLPRAQCTIRIYTLAGDLVQTIAHDARRGDGQASWNLISRNGQDVEAGVYLFTVSSALGHQTGKFVLLR